jgi:hypothetical protein
VTSWRLSHSCIERGGAGRVQSNPRQGHERPMRGGRLWRQSPKEEVARRMAEEATRKSMDLKQLAPSIGWDLEPIVRRPDAVGTLSLYASAEDRRSWLLTSLDRVGRRCRCGKASDEECCWMREVHCQKCRKSRRDRPWLRPTDESYIRTGRCREPNCVLMRRYGPVRKHKIVRPIPWCIRNLDSKSLSADCDALGASCRPRCRRRFSTAASRLSTGCIAHGFQPACPNAQSTWAAWRRVGPSP